MAGLYDDLLEEEQKKSSPLPEFTGEGRPMPPALGGPAPATRGLYDDLLTTEGAPDQQPELAAWQVPGEFIKNGPQNAAKFFGGLWQSLVNPGETIKQVTDMAGGIPSHLVDPVAREAMLADNPRAQEMHASTQSVIDGFREDFGSWRGFKNHVGREPVEFLANAATVLPGGQAVNPTRVLNPLARGAGRATRAAVNALDPQSQLMMRAAEGQAPAILGALRNPNLEIVPGSVPTAGQAASNQLTATRFQALDKAAQKRLPTEATNIKNDQNAARLAQIRTVGRTPADLEAAVRARDASSRTNYAAANSVMSTADQPLIDLFERPSMDKVFARARQIAEERGVDFQVGTTAPAGTAPSSLVNPVTGLPITTSTPATFAQYPGRSLHIVKQAFDDMIKNPEQFGIGASEVRAIQGTRGEFIRWFENSNPAYERARLDHAAASPPIDQMRIGQYLERKLQNPTMVEDTPTLRADAFSNATQEAVTRNTNIKRATGEQRYNNLDDILTPTQMNAVQSIQDDLARAKLAETQANAASQYSGALNTAMSDTLTPQAPGFLNPVVTVINALARSATGHIDERVAGRVANAMLTPEGAAEILEQAITRERRLNNASIPFHIGGRAVGAINRAPAAYNALQYEREKPKK